MFLSICIPTYNRAKDLDKNLNLITSFIKNNNLDGVVDIVVSNNCSPDNTKEVLLKHEASGVLKSIHQTINTGAVYNMLYVIEAADGEYFMLMGDDDFMIQEYLLGVLDILKQHKDIDCIIPNFVKMMPDGSFPFKSRDYGVPSKFYPKGYKSCRKLMCKAHQLSGIVLRRKGTVEYFEKNDIYTLYPQIVMVARSVLHDNSYHFTKYPIKVSQPEQAKKDWTYGKDGLLSDCLGGVKNMDEPYITRTFLQCIVVKHLTCRITLYDTWKKRRVFVWVNLTSKKMMLLAKFNFVLRVLLYDMYFILKKTFIYDLAKKIYLKKLNSLPKEEIR